MNTGLTYTYTKPTAPGWYWCKNEGDISGTLWEAVVRIEKIELGLVCCWLSSPGSASTLHESQWSEHCLWAGPINPPTT